MPNKHIDLFKDMIPAVDMGLKDLWEVASEEGRKEIKGDLWNLNRYISSVKSNNRELQEHYLILVNELYNKNYASASKHPKLMWLLLCSCHHESKKTHFHEWIPLKRTSDNKNIKLLMDIYPTAKVEDLELLSKILGAKGLRQLARDHGYNDKQIKDLKL
jgi:hypothetical protein